MKKEFFYTAVASLMLSTVTLTAQSSMQHGVHFGYDGKTAPSHWDTLKKEWKTCSKGTVMNSVVRAKLHQSPVDFKSAIPVQPNFTVDYDKKMEFKIQNNGHSVQFDAVGDTQASMVIDGKSYALKQFHFHYLSEHTEKGKHSDMEVHLVHVAKDGSLAVLGVFIDTVSDSGNSELEKAFSLSIPKEGKKGATVSINPIHMLPFGKVYNYSGSLTTPPCSEGVIWNVFTTHIGLSKEKVAAFKEHYHNNYRPVTGSY